MYDSRPDLGTTLEKFRYGHEEIERLEQLVIKELQLDHPTPVKRLMQGHRLQFLANSILLKTHKLVETYKKSGDLELLRDQAATRKTVMTAFSHRLQEIDEYHRKHPCVGLVDAGEALLKEEPVITFSREEGNGRYLDLRHMYNLYINSSLGERLEYSAYLDGFSQPEKIPRRLKSSRHYAQYMAALLEYLISFFKRTEPMRELDSMLSKVETDFKMKYKDYKLGGWEYYSEEEVMDAEEPQQPTEAFLRDGSVMEAKVKKLCSLLYGTIKRTKQNHTEEESYDYNPPKLAMGWDGKPIPYWIYKLGIGQEYNCEICGNHSYRGKRAFERHFKDARHQIGLCHLGITGFERFNGITLVVVAKLAWRTIKDRLTARETKEKNSKLALEASGVAIPPLEIARVVERCAYLNAMGGLDHERRRKALYEKSAIFSFLNSSDPYHPFYQHKLTECRANPTEPLLFPVEILAFNPTHPEVYYAPLASSQSAMGVAIPPPNIAKVIARTARITSKKDDELTFERKLIDGLGLGHMERFKFLNSSDRYHTFYQYKVIEYREGAEAAARHLKLEGEYKAAPVALEPHKFTYKLPERIKTAKELDIIKLAAQFKARYGECFWEGCMDRVLTDPLFGFMKPIDERFILFNRLVNGYCEVLRSPKVSRNKGSDIETVLDNCYHRLQWDRSGKEHWEKAKNKKRARMHDEFQVIKENNPYIILMELESEALREEAQRKKQKKLDETELVPEDEFLAQHPEGPATVIVHFPRTLHAYFEVEVQSLLETVATVKEGIARRYNHFESKHNLSGKTGILKDHKSLAHYNVAPRDVLTIV